MAELIPRNAASGTITDNPLADDATEINLDTGQGDAFHEPDTGEADGVRAIIVPADAETPFELVAITERVGDVLTQVERGIEDTTPLEWPEGSRIAEVLTRGGLDDLLDQAVAEAVSEQSMVMLADDLLAGAQASFDFTSIPATYKHLRLVLYLRGSAAATEVVAKLRFNNDSGTNYDWQKHYAAGSSGGAGETMSDNEIELADATAGSSPAGAVSVLDILIPNYAEETLQKAVTYHAFNPRNGAGTEYVFHGGGIWKSTAAINRVTVLPGSGNWVAGSRATLYGMR